MTLRTLAFIGLGVFSVGFPLVIFVRLRAQANRFHPKVMRHYGYFFSGLRPSFWWWDVLIKRADLLLVMTITYTDVVFDERAKLLWHTFLSGAMLALHNAFKPYDRRQCGLIDTAEAFALTTRFTTYVMISGLLLFDAEIIATWILGLVVLVGNAAFIIYMSRRALALALTSHERGKQLLAEPRAHRFRRSKE